MLSEMQTFCVVFFLISFRENVCGDSLTSVLETLRNSTIWNLHGKSISSSPLRVLVLSSNNIYKFVELVSQKVPNSIPTAKSEPIPVFYKGVSCRNLI